MANLLHRRQERLEEDIENMKASIPTPEELKESIEHDSEPRHSRREAKRAADKAKKEADKKAADELHWTAKDTLAMTIAIIEIIGPFILVAVAVFFVIFLLIELGG